MSSRASGPGGGKTASPAVEQRADLAVRPADGGGRGDHLRADDTPAVQLPRRQPVDRGLVEADQRPSGPEMRCSSSWMIRSGGRSAVRADDPGGRDVADLGMPALAAVHVLQVVIDEAVALAASADAPEQSGGLAPSTAAGRTCRPWRSTGREGAGRSPRRRRAPAAPVSAVGWPGDRPERTERLRADDQRAAEVWSTSMSRPLFDGRSRTTGSW